MKTNFALFLINYLRRRHGVGLGLARHRQDHAGLCRRPAGARDDLIQIYREATGWETAADTTGIDMDESGENQLDEATARKRTLAFFAWFIGGALGIWLIGIVYALPLLVFLYALLQGKEKWLTSLIIGGCAYLMIWGLFEYMLETRWPAGILFGY